MNTVTPEKRGVETRGLAIAGLIGLIFLIAWLSVQIISIAPSAFSSLASIAAGITQYQEAMVEESVPLELAGPADVISSGDTVVLSWKAASEAGTYAISFSCVDNVKISVLNEDGVRDINCGTNYNLGGVTEVSVIPTIGATEYVEIPYSITYSKLNETTANRTGAATLTAVNREVVITPDEETEAEKTFEDTTPVTAPSDETPVTTEPTYEYEYAIPVSNPNGNVDLAIKFVGVGGIVNNRYASGILEQNSSGAVQFEVKNLGTKTSKDWKFSITLPDGSTYTSDTQTPLKPNERATLTIGIQTGDSATHTFVGRISTDEDSSTVNNRFSNTVTIQR